ncbi:MAG: recombinase family protein [Limnohabitans sp.]|nr:recombinase family protein [Limnohabitans sp.]
MIRAEAIRLFEVISNFKGNSVTVVIDSIDRLGRNLLNILFTIEIFNANSINLKSLKEGFETVLDGKENPTAKMVISVMGSIAEMERNKIKERQTEGVLIAKAQGKFKGRKVGSTISNQQFISRYPLVVQKLKKGYLFVILLTLLLLVLLLF